MVTDRRYVKDTEMISGEKHAVVECPNCGGDLFRPARYFEVGEGSEGFSTCSSCGERIEYSIPKKDTELEYLRVA